jgi:two-component system chemotaxis response regulator CheB
MSPASTVPPIRVLLVDDAVVIRHLLTEILGTDPEIEIAGTAANGRIALQKMTQVNPDVVILDIEMPVMDGLTTLRELRNDWPRLPVIMFSTLTERGAGATLDALSLGASDYATKPSNTPSAEAALASVRDELLPKIKALGRRPAPVRMPLPTSMRSVGTRGAGTRTARPVVEAVVIGVSTGGPVALAELIPALPADFPVPVLVVQHMPPVFTRLLADRLDAQSGLAVREGHDGDAVQAGSVLIAPGDRHMVIVRDRTSIRVATNDGPPENSCRPAVDPLFRSAAAVYGEGTLAVVLTGMGHDGLLGSQRVREVNGNVIAQDQATSVVWGMPGSVAESGVATSVLPIEEIAAEIVHLVAQGRTLQPTAFASRSSSS